MIPFPKGLPRTPPPRPARATPRHPLPEQGATWMVVGLMSGTSMDGIDAALIETDGETVCGIGPHLTVPYEDGFRAVLRANLGRTSLTDEDGRRLNRDLALRHAQVVRALLAGSDIAPDMIGFHGHTLWHDPVARLTVQAGDPALLAKDLGIPVVADLRQADIAAGGEGAPLVPIYHAALSRDLDRPIAVLNVGGVANVTWIGKRGVDDMVAFDTGPGNGPLDDWVARHTGRSCDEDGRLAAAGTLAEDRLLTLMQAPYFGRPAPKSLDRREFDHVLQALEGLSVEDGATTLVALIAAAVVQGAAHMPLPPKRWLVTGGGRLNPVLMETLAGWLDAPVEPVEAVGWDGDAIEAQAFAFLAARFRRQLPITFPGTTGAPFPMVGGRLYRP